MIVAARGASLHIYVDFYCISSCSILIYKTNSFGAWLWWMWCTRQIGCYMYWAACDMCLCIFMWYVDTIWTLNIVLICAKNCIFFYIKLFCWTVCRCKCMECWMIWQWTCGNRLSVAKEWLHAICRCKYSLQQTICRKKYHLTLKIFSDRTYSACTSLSL